MSIVGYVLKHPYTVAASLALVCILGIGAGMRMPVDIFPEIDIPVVSVVWTYNGMNARDIQNRILTLHERQMASLVDDISRIEANSYDGVGVEKVFLHEGADVTRAVSQLASSALVVLKYMPPNITPPLVLRYGATDVPIIQLSLSSSSLPDTKLNDLGQNIILPSGDVKIGTKDYSLAMNNTPDAIAAINQFPVKQVTGQTVFVHDVAHVHDGFQIQTNSVTVDGRPVLRTVIRAP